MIDTWGCLTLLMIFSITYQKEKKRCMIDIDTIKIAMMLCRIIKLFAKEIKCSYPSIP